ncbi:MAG: peptidase [Cyanobacteria bacterium RYN_339]|nr:peptidase [Cyanobacteria bacterium RYN_339]
MRMPRHLPIVIATLLLAGCGGKGAGGTLVTVPLASAQRVALAPGVTVTKGAAEVAPANTTQPDEAVPGELIVHFKGGARDLPGATRDRQLGLSNTYVYKLKPNAYSLMAVNDWESAPDVDYVEPNFIYRVAGTPADPDFNLSWGVGAIHAPDVWGITQGEGITIAVVDTGVAANQPDLAGQVLPGLDLVNHDNDASDDHGHGTHVAGTIAALANNGLGVAGVAPHAKILPIKVLDAQGTGTNQAIADGIVEAATRGAKIINMSLGGPSSSESIRRAIAKVQAMGVVVICAAGNDNVSDNFYPAACDEVIGVASVDSAYKKSYFSNFGGYIDIAAPGSSIGSLNFKGGTLTMSGTSMASPHVAGTAALLLSAFPKLTAGNIQTALQRGGRATTGFSGSAPKGLDAEAALTAVAALDLTPPSRVTGLAANGGRPGDVDLTWAPATDNVGVAGYRILRDGMAIGTAAATHFTDPGVAAAGRYTVQAFDADGTDGAASDAINGQPGAVSEAITALGAKERGTDHLTITWHTVTPMRCTLSWGDTADMANLTQPEATASTEHTARIEHLARFRSYRFRVNAADAQAQPHYSDIAKARTKIWWLF